MQFKVNGKPEVRESEISVAAFLASVEVDPARVAVEVNDRFLRREEYAVTLLRDGDRVEIAKMVGGGA